MVQVQSEFWHDLEVAYRQVRNNPNLEVTVARDGKEAQVFSVDAEGRDCVGIEIIEADTESRTVLPVP
jgi:hypothetical protein